MGDTSVPGVEMSDLNDGDILARTRENVNPNGQFQFVYVPETGDPITSDWVGQDFKKQVLRGWVDGVKSAIIGRGHAGIQAANEAAAEAKLKRLQQEQMEVEEDDAAIPSDDGVGVDTSAAPVGTGTKLRGAVQQSTRPAQRVSAPSADPSTYVEDQLELARERLRAAEQAQQDITREVLTARRDYDKWQALSAALGGIGDDGLRGTDGPSGSNIETAKSLRGVEYVERVLPSVREQSGKLRTQPGQPQGVRR
jgi:hypothetical protein